MGEENKKRAYGGGQKVGCVQRVTKYIPGTIIITLDSPVQLYRYK